MTSTNVNMPVPESFRYTINSPLWSGMDTIEVRVYAKGQKTFWVNSDDNDSSTLLEFPYEQIDELITALSVAKLVMEAESTYP